LALQATDLVLYTMDRNLRYTWVCNSEVGFVGDDRVIGLTDQEIFGPGVARQLTRINRRALAGMPVLTELELELARGRSTFEFAVGPLKTAGGQVVGIAGVACEITPREQAARLGQAV
jgi:hypothetical protein